MKSSGRMKLYMSIGLAIMLVIQMIVFMFLRPDTLNMVLVLFGLIVMIGIFAILMNYYHLKKTEERVQDLPADYKSFYIDANEAIGLSSMKRGNKNDTMSMILEILEHAYEDKRHLVDVIGPNPRTYIETFIKASGGELTPLYLLGYSLGNFMLFLLLMKVYKLIKIGEISALVLREQTLDFGIVATYSLIAFVFLPWLLIIMQKAAAGQWQGLKRIWVLVPFFIPLGLVVFLIYVDTPRLRNWLDRPLPIFSNIYLLVGGIVVTAVGFLIAGYARKKQLQNAIDL